MTNFPTERKRNSRQNNLKLGIGFLVILLAIGFVVSCQKEGSVEGARSEGGSVVAKGTNKFEGVVMAGVGKYFFIPGAQGIDLVIQGSVESGDTSTLVNKEVKVKGEFSLKNPSLLAVDTIDVKEGERNWRNIYTRTEEIVLDDYLDSAARDEFEKLEDLDYSKKEGWEGKKKAKVLGKFEKTTENEGEEEKDIYSIIVFDEGKKEVGKILVDNITDFAIYYVNKLRLFDTFWIYMNVKETVDWSQRRRSKELFHADVLFAGLY